MPNQLRHTGRVAGPAARFCQQGLRAVLAALLLAGSPPVLAVEVTALYSVEVPYERGDPQAQQNAYQLALTQVLVRVTGTTAAADSEELALLFPDPARYVLQYRPGPDGSLIVTFDGPAIERELRAYGATVCGIERPQTMVWLAVDRGAGDREIVAAADADRPRLPRFGVDRNRDLRQRVLDAATFRGVPIALPAMDSADLENVSFTDIWGGFDERLLGASARYGASSILVGRIRPQQDAPDRWTWYFGSQRRDWQGEPEESINHLADALAPVFCFSGTEPPEVIRLTISGIGSVAAYGRVQSFLENLRILDELIIDTVAGDRITYRVRVQGGITRLENALEQSGLLVPAPPDRSVDRPVFDVNGRPLSRTLPVDTGGLRYRYRGESPGRAGF